MADRSQGDPYAEPENGTVDDWHGQEFARDEHRLVEDTDGDLEAAERRFGDESEGTDAHCRK